MDKKSEPKMVLSGYSWVKSTFGGDEIPCKGPSKMRASDTESLSGVEALASVVINMVKQGNEKYVVETLKESISQAVATARKEEIRKIKVHFETMVFDNTGKDKLVNIMEFRKAQSKYLDSLSVQEEKKI